MPSNRDVDAPPIGGAVLFGIAWGLVGLCRPRIVNFSSGSPAAILFAVAMAVGMVARNLMQRGRARTNASAPGLAD